MNGHEWRAASGELAEWVRTAERVNVRPLVGKAKRTPGGWSRVRAYAARSLHLWVIGAVGADLVRTAAWTRRSDPGAIGKN